MGTLSIVRKKKLAQVKIIICEDLDQVPNAPEKGTIAIISPYPLGTVYIQRARPVIPRAGDVWVKTGTLAGSVEEIWRYLGVWIKETVAVYTNGWWGFTQGTTLYTGECDFGEDNEIRFLTNGKLMLDEDMIADVFLVGGGGAGKYGGGGGGYTKTARGVQLIAGQEYEIVIGEGAKAATTSTTYAEKGGATSAFGITAEGGGVAGPSTSSSSTARLSGGPGGSGGGGGGSANGGDGGSNGADGKAVTSYGAKGAGQGYTTRAFGEETGALYAAGGGGCGGENKTQGMGGEPGAGDGAYYSTADMSAKPNTGSGGGGTWKSEGRVSYGGSGIVILRKSKPVKRQYLYSADDEHVGFTNGWVGEPKLSVGGSGVKKSADIVRENGMLVLDNLADKGGVIRPSLGVDLTLYKTLVFEGEFQRGGDRARNLTAAVWSKIGTYYATASEMRVYFQMANAETINRIELDVSDLEGLGYPGIGVTDSCVKITACYLEPKEA